MTLRATISSIRIRKKLSEPFDTKRGTVYSKPAILLGYADESLAQPFPNIEKEAKAVGLVDIRGKLDNICMYILMYTECY